MIWQQILRSQENPTIHIQEGQSWACILTTIFCYNIQHCTGWSMQANLAASSVAQLTLLRWSASAKSISVWPIKSFLTNDGSFGRPNTIEPFSPSTSQGWRNSSHSRRDSCWEHQRAINKFEEGTGSTYQAYQEFDQFGTGASILGWSSNESRVVAL
jgi:hypothetical protein